MVTLLESVKVCMAEHHQGAEMKPAKYHQMFEEQRSAKDAAEFAELVKSMNYWQLLRLRLFMLWLSWRDRLRR